MSDNLTVERPECEQLPLVERLRIFAGLRAMGDPTAFGEDAALFEEAADRIEALEAEVERLLGELVDATELLGYRDRDIEKFRKGILAFTAEVARLQARERELEARLRMTQSVLWDDDGADLGCATAWREALLRSRKLMDAALAAVSAETEEREVLVGTRTKAELRDFVKRSLNRLAPSVRKRIKWDGDAS